MLSIAFPDCYALSQRVKLEAAAASAASSSNLPLSAVAYEQLRELNLLLSATQVEDNNDAWFAPEFRTSPPDILRLPRWSSYARARLQEAERHTQAEEKHHPLRAGTSVQVASSKRPIAAKRRPSVP